MKLHRCPYAVYSVKGEGNVNYHGVYPSCERSERKFEALIQLCKAGIVTKFTPNSVYCTMDPFKVV